MGTVDHRVGLAGPRDLIAQSRGKLARCLGRLLWLVAALLISVIGIIAWNTVAFTSKQVHVKPVQAIEPLPGFEERLTRALQFRTIANGTDGSGKSSPFDELHEFLRTSFPRVHARIDREVHGGRSLLYRWKGSDPAQEPILLMSHVDVVPIEPGTETSWTHPPFSGDRAGGFIWGRGRST